MNKITAKLTLFANGDNGKTQTLKSLIYLISKSVSGACVINNKYYPTFSVSNLKFHKDIRFACKYTNPQGLFCYIDICTQGDNDVIVRENWDFFLQREKYANIYQEDKKSHIEPFICISPCHVSDPSCDQEEFEQHMYTHFDIKLWQRMCKIDNSISDDEVKEFDKLDIFYTKKVAKPTLGEKKNSIALAYRLKQQIDDIIDKQYFII